MIFISGDSEEHGDHEIRKPFTKFQKHDITAERATERVGCPHGPRRRHGRWGPSPEVVGTMALPPATDAASDIVCFTCNVGLGGFGDNQVLLARAIDYLKGDLWLIQRESPGVYRLCS